MHMYTYKSISYDTFFLVLSLCTKYSSDYAHWIIKYNEEDVKQKLCLFVL